MKIQYSQDPKESTTEKDGTTKASHLDLAGGPIRSQKFKFSLMAVALTSFLEQEATIAENVESRCFIIL